MTTMGVCHKHVSSDTLTLRPRKAEKPASPTVTKSGKAKILSRRSLIYSRKDEISAWKFREKTVTNNVVSGSSRSGDPMLWELRGDRVKPSSDYLPYLTCCESVCMTEPAKCLTEPAVDDSDITQLRQAETVSTAKSR